jgi:hypothetical protein
MALLSWLRTLVKLKAVPSVKVQYEIHEMDYSTPVRKDNPLDYDQLIPLDAEDLAEQGIREAYEALLPALRKHVAEPKALEEVVDADTGTYSVLFAGQEHLVYGPQASGTEGDSWGRATFIFFQIINSQLSETPVRFYALNSGNDLAGMFLSPETAQLAQSKLPRKSDWPYIPDLSSPWYGQHH